MSATSESRFQQGSLQEGLGAEIELENVSIIGSLFEKATSIDETGPEFLLEEAEELAEDLLEEPLEAEAEVLEEVSSQELSTDTDGDSEGQGGSGDDLKVHEEE